MDVVDHHIDFNQAGLSIDNYFVISPGSKYRCQYLTYEVMLPIGTVVTFSQYSRILDGISWQHRDKDKYVMTDAGLERLDREG